MWPTLFKIPLIHLPIRGYGLMLMIAFLGGTWWAARRAARVKADYDFVVNLGFVALIFSVIGARIFYVAHYWEESFAGRGLWTVVNVSAGGLEFYGGFLGALFAGLGYMIIKGYSVRLYLDIIAPSLMFGMGAARIGCFLNGCCWGGAISPEIPWGVQFPYASPCYYRQWEERQITAPAELLYINPDGVAYPIPRDMLLQTPEELEGPRIKLEQAEAEMAQAKSSGADSRTIAKLAKKSDKARKRLDAVRGNNRAMIQQMDKYHLTQTQLRDMANLQRSKPVHPAQLYASMDGFLLALLLSCYFYRRKRHGMVFAVLLLVYPVIRILEEMVRIDNPHDTAGMTVSQFVSVLLIAVGAAMFVYLRKAPLRSPKAVPYIPPPMPEPKSRK